MAFSVRKDAVRRDGGFLAGRVLSWFLQGGRRQRQLTGRSCPKRNTAEPASRTDSPLPAGLARSVGICPEEFLFSSHCSLHRRKAFCAKWEHLSTRWRHTPCSPVDALSRNEAGQDLVWVGSPQRARRSFVPLTLSWEPQYFDGKTYG